MKLDPELTRKILSQAQVGPAVNLPRPEPKDENEFLWQVTRYAQGRGWLVYHTHDSRRSERGFPDLVMVRERVVYAELKMPRGRVTKSQQSWLGKLLAAGVEAYLWRPDYWYEIESVLKETP